MASKFMNRISREGSEKIKKMSHMAMGGEKVEDVKDRKHSVSVPETTRKTSVNYAKTFQYWASRSLKNYTTDALACPMEGSTRFERIEIKRNDFGADDVLIDIQFCGVCHTDVHMLRDYGPKETHYPFVPGHEIAGIVAEVGSNVEKFKPGDKIGVGCIVESCGTCKPCCSNNEQYCSNGMTMTCGSKTKYGMIRTGTGYTHGGYSRKMTVNQKYVIAIPKDYPLPMAGPMLCVGVAVYNPLKLYGADKGGMKVGVIGIGGMGHLGVRMAAAFGNHVTAISTSPNKQQKCRDLGAKEFVVSTNKEAMEDAAGSLDLILNTIPAPHQISDYLPLLAFKGTIVQLGFNEENHVVNQMPLMYQRLSIGASMIGGIAETQECLNICAEKDIKPDCEIINADRIEWVHEKLARNNDSTKKYVLDLESLR